MATPSKHAALIEDLGNNRLYRIMFAPVDETSTMRNSLTKPDEHKKVHEETELRLHEIREIIGSYPSEEGSKIARLLNDIDLHYVASTFLNLFNKNPNENPCWILSKKLMRKSMVGETQRESPRLSDSPSLR